MEHIIIDLDNDSYIIHLNKDDHWKSGHVYPIDKYTDRKEPPFFGYHSNEGGAGYLGTAESARCLFEFSFCWRGVWEGRIYFKDDEYWSEELEEMHLLWCEIEKLFKERIRKENPDNTYDD